MLVKAVASISYVLAEESWWLMRVSEMERWGTLPFLFPSFPLFHPAKMLCWDWRDIHGNLRHIP